MKTKGYIVDLAPYLEQYAPDLYRLLEEHPDWKKAITMEDGAIPAQARSVFPLPERNGTWGFFISR